MGVRVQWSDQSNMTWSDAVVWDRRKPGEPFVLRDADTNRLAEIPEAGVVYVALVEDSYPGIWSTTEGGGADGL